MTLLNTHVLLRLRHHLRAQALTLTLTPIQVQAQAQIAPKILPSGMETDVCLASCLTIGTMTPIIVRLALKDNIMIFRKRDA